MSDVIDSDTKRRTNTAHKKRNAEHDGADEEREKKHPTGCTNLYPPLVHKNTLTI